MKFNKFYISVSLRIILILVSCILFTLFINSDDKIMNTIILGLLIILQTYLLINYVNKTNKDLAAFLTYLSVGDTSIAFNPKNIEKTFKGLHYSFKEINERYKDIRSKGVSQKQYIDFIIEKLNTGIIAYTEDGKIDFINSEAKSILGVNNITLISNLKQKNYDIYKTLLSLKPGKATVTKMLVKESPVPISIKLSIFKQNQQKIHFISLQDIKQELEMNEIESWQKLIRVLTHEMMNSLTPITSLATGTKRYLQDKGNRKKLSDLNPEILDDIYTNSEIIEERSKSLLEFINHYKTITKPPSLKISQFNISAMLDSLNLFFKDILLENSIVFNIHIDETLLLTSDEKLIKQVLINILKNSIEAIGTNGTIDLAVNKLDTGETRIDIKDNGKGISPENLEQIFIPFYTTKEKGSGIGLSFSKQIIKLLGGTINITSVMNKYTLITIII